MSDPKSVFAEGSETMREVLKGIWPELYTALMPPAGSGTVVGCVLGSCVDRPAATRPRAVGRVSLNGPPACEEHVAASRRPGGYPLALTDPRLGRN